MGNDKLTRREFVKATTIIAFGSVTAIRCHSAKGDTDETLIDCQTTDDILGPFYKAGSPFREQVDPNPQGDNSLVVTGVVFTECNKPVADAIVEIWNADPTGIYDNSEAYNFRGRYRTQADGTYRFQTIIPGRYLNGDTYRPSHIHFRITAPGFAELVSQIYFQNDPFLSTDPWASASKAKDRILPVSKDSNWMSMVTFDIHLPKLM